MVKKMHFLDLAILLIISIPAFISILNNSYFSMHDDQHVARLYLLINGITQGNLYPRWVDGLGFGYGYPLFNFYPPFIYYVGFIFKVLGFSLVWSVKLVFISGFIVGIVGTYLFIRSRLDRLSAFFGATLYTFFFYKAVLVYARGALAEFFSAAIIPFVFLSLDKILTKPSLKNSFLFAIAFALLILSHPFTSFSSILFIGLYVIIYIFTNLKQWKSMISFSVVGIVFGLGLSAFFWLPSMVEKQFTLVDSILIKELANYKLHYIYLQQFLYSPWGYGGSAAGPFDGITFQLGKVHLGAVILAVSLSLLLLLKRSVRNINLPLFFLTIILLMFSLFMTTSYSSFIWDNIKFLWYLQFPWRFLSFTNLFLAIAGSFSIYFLRNFLPKKLFGGLTLLITVVVIFATIIIYSKYFKPQRYLQVTDSSLTTKKEISWRVSGTSYEFVPVGVNTRKTSLNTTTLDIDENDIPQSPFSIVDGIGEVNVAKNLFSEKVFNVKAQTPIEFQLNTYNFPGWTAYLIKNKEKQQLKITDNNDLKLITLALPQGNYQISALFKNTPIRTVANIISLSSFLLVVILWRLRRMFQID